MILNHTQIYSQDRIDTKEIKIISDDDEIIRNSAVNSASQIAQISSIAAKIAYEICDGCKGL